MATGQDTGHGAGLFAEPDVPELGAMTWAQMGGVHPDSPLVGGRNPYDGGVSAQYNYRRVAVASIDPTPATGGSRQHYSELFNLKGNPLPWVMFAAIAYLGLVHLSISGSAGYGRK